MKYFALALLVTLAACGSQRDLRPVQGQALPPAPYGSEAQPSAGDLIQPNAQARPSRSDEVLTESSERQGDAFDLPPP